LIDLIVVTEVIEVTVVVLVAVIEVTEEIVARRLAEMYARIGVSSRGEAAVLAFREGMV